MKKYRHFPPESPVCPICGTNKNKAFFLMPIAGTFKKGLCHGQPVHVTCMLGRVKDFVWYREEKVMVLNLEDSDESHP